MTVCIAAASWRNVSGSPRPVIIGASDRMITSGGDVEYEPVRSKVYQVAQRVVVLVAGDISAHTIAVQMRDRFVALGSVSVSQVADAYAEQLRLRRADHVLGPLGLTRDTFIARQRTMEPVLVESLAKRLAAEDRDDEGGVESIVAGIDGRAHIYTILDNGEITCNDHEGFATVGAGASLAADEFMFERYAPNNSAQAFEATVYLTYAAKKRAESAPGVGRDTDFFVIESVYTHTASGAPLLNDLEAAWQAARRRQQAAQRAGYVKITRRAGEMFRD